MPSPQTDLRPAPTSTASTQLPHMVQLDGLRAFAVVAVMLYHFLAPKYPFMGHWGEWGVRLFFVLSGFLITGILLRCRDLRTSSVEAHPLKNFYIRRGLRIFPLFYLVVLLTALVNIRPSREVLLWNLTYTTNVYFALRGAWNGPVTHFWSLAVEEQFYLFWPFLILFLPRKSLFGFICFAILLAPIYQIIGYFLGLNNLELQIITIACLNYLGIGALLAFFRYSRPENYRVLANDFRYNFVGIALLALMIGIPFCFPNYLPKLILNGAATSLLFGWIIHRASVGFPGWIGAVLQWRPLIFIGSISYGIYVYHNFMPVIAPHLLKILHITWPQNPLFYTSIYIFMTLATATISWFAFERPINELKSHFNYRDN